MRKIVYLILSIVLITTVAGCQNNVKKKIDPNNQIKVAKTTKTLKIEPLKIKSDHDLKKNNKNEIISIKFKIKNLTKKSVVASAPDFIIKSGESVYYMGEGLNFSKKIKAHKTVTGTGYYEVPKKLKKFTLMFVPMDRDESLKWKIKR